MNDSPLSLLLTLSPLLATWLAGLALASARLRRHPEVSLLLMGGQASMIASDVAGPVVFSVMLEPSSGADPIMLAIAFLGILAVQSAAWVATLVALFGWRADEQQASASDKFQFGLRSLLFVMFAAGVLSGMAAGAARLLLIPVIGFVSLAVQLPTFTAWFFGTWIAMARWPRHPAVSRAAMIGLGIGCATVVVEHFVWVWVSDRQERYAVVGALRLIFSTLVALSWIALLRAALGWRSGDKAFASSEGDPYLMPTADAEPTT
jgi:hypothetical protein